VLLAREVARRGVRTTTATVRELMTALHDKYPDDREQSLYASVELSLRRLAPEVRAQLQPLTVCQGGVSLVVWSWMTGTDVETIRSLAAAVVGVGLGTDMGYGHLRLDPALPSYLLQELNQTDQEHLRTRWAEEMVELVHFLEEETFQEAIIARQLTLLELPNLLTLLRWLQDKEAPETVVDVASRVEALLADLGLPHALLQVTTIREQVAQILGEWSRARFMAESENIERLLERGALPAAYIAAQHLLEHCLEAGESAYTLAAYDIALAYTKLGKTLRHLGDAETALQPLTEARERFQALANSGHSMSRSMVPIAIAEYGDCLKDLGRLDEAASVYEEVIQLAEHLGDKRHIATAKGQLGTVRIWQQRYNEALAACIEAGEIFDALGEPGSIAAAWHQIGIVYRYKGKFEQAERAYRQSLAIEVQRGNRPGEATSLSELGCLYDDMGRLEEAVIFSRQAADIYDALQNLSAESGVRHNLAGFLIKLERYDEARQELLRAIECNNLFGHAAQPWKSWDLLYDLEQTTGNAPAATDARQQAVQCYLEYRRDGGESQQPSARLCAFIANAMRQGDTTAVAQELAYLAAMTDPPPRLQTMLPKLHAILHGDRNPTLAADLALEYDDAAELLLLLETLGARDMESKE
jgi:tetratricopeptide (TPR) repeat protein